jgi:hypothetical protein
MRGMNVLQKLRQTVGDVQKPRSPKHASEAWELAGRLLGRLPVDAQEAARICGARDASALDALVARLEGIASAPVAAVVVDEKEMDRALKAFKKRMQLMQLAEESKLGGRQLTAGRKTTIDAIVPPGEFPDEVWKALAAAGRLKHTGQGFYALA